MNKSDYLDVFDKVDNPKDFVLKLVAKLLAEEEQVNLPSGKTRRVQLLGSLMKNVDQRQVLEDSLLEEEEATNSMIADAVKDALQSAETTATPRLDKVPILEALASPSLKAARRINKVAKKLNISYGSIKNK